MAQVRSLAAMRSTTLRRVGNSTQIAASDVDAILQDVHRDIATAFQWSQRRREALIQTVAPYSTGTVSLTAGSSTITGSGTAWTASMVGSAIAVAPENSYFFVQAVNVGAQTLVLGDAQGTLVVWNGASAAGQTYRIFQHQYLLGTNIAVVLAGVRNFRLRERSRAHVDGKDPMRQSTGQPSEFFLARNNISAGVEQVFIEFWPVPDAVYYERIPFLIEPPDLVAAGDLPVCPSEPLEWRAASEAALFILTKTGDARWGTLGEKYWAIFAGGTLAGMEVQGVLEQALRDDQHRFGLPQTLADGDTIVGNDILKTRDWDLVG